MHGYRLSKLYIPLLLILALALCYTVSTSVATGAVSFDIGWQVDHPGLKSFDVTSAETDDFNVTVESYADYGALDVVAGSKYLVSAYRAPDSEQIPANRLKPDKVPWS